VYYRQEKFELSEYHFRHALGINGRSSVLYCYLGMALHALRRTADALDLLRRAIALDARNPLAWPPRRSANRTRKALLQHSQL
jgi:anaphase-promoting complex subunit 3